jgi:hypothetical protein
MSNPIVPYIAQPLHTGFGSYWGSWLALTRRATTRQVATVISPSTNSILPENFNSHLCAAVNMDDPKCTHFAMLHGDIEPQPGWLDILFDELWASKADVVSAVVPFKSMKGLTSTAIGERLPNGRPKHTKLTMADVAKLPETFGIEDTPWPDKQLWVNSGCMLFSIESPWVKEFLRSGGFGFETWVEEHEGRFISQAFSEDWRMSAWCAENGVKCVATRKVQLNHWGCHAFGNVGSWGDPQYNAIKESEVVA